MTKTKKLPLILSIENGTVIDHIPVKNSFKLIQLLQLENIKNRLSFASNLDSNKIRKKSILKIENTFFSQNELDLISIFAPNCRINIIKNKQIVKKFNLNIPDQIKTTLTCPNLRCITHHNKTDSLFIFNKKLSTEQAILLNCYYCEFIFKVEQLQLK